MARNDHRKGTPQVRGNRGRPQGRTAPRSASTDTGTDQEPDAADSHPAGNFVPAQPETQPALLLEVKPGSLQVPAQALSTENAPEDVLQVRFKGNDGEKSLSIVGLSRLIKEICRPILSCGLVLGLTAVSIVSVIYLLVPTGSARDKALGGLGIAVTTVCIWLGIWAKRHVGQQIRRWTRERRDKAATDDADRGESRLPGSNGPAR
jgi:hypothetical protein